MQGIAQKILAEPGKYSIQQLTQAVQNGTLPAYIGVPIIQDKVQQQKQSQMMQQGQQAQQNAPPIAQQVMQEAQGLEALPTNLPQEYAGGGIVAFEEGGEVERYQNKGLVGGPSGGSLYPYNAPEAGKFSYIAGETPEERRYREFLATPEGREAQIRKDRAGLLAPFAAAADIPSGFYNGIAGLTQMGANAVGIPRLGRALGIYDKDVTSVEIPKIGTGTGTPYFDRLKAYAAGTNTDPAANAAAAAAPAAPAKTAIAPPPVNTGPAKTKPNANLGGDSALDRKPSLGVKEPTPDLVAQTNTLLKDFTARDEKRLADLDVKVKEAEGKVTGKAYESLEKSLTKEAQEFGADKAQAKNMAIFKAGLAMMAGTSRNALENIGKGAMTGAEDYQAAAKDIKKAQKENERAMAMVEQARRAEALGDRDKSIDRMYKANEHFGERDKFGTSAVMNATGKNAELSNDIWKTQFNADKSLEVARIGANATVQAAQTRANRESGISPYQMANLRVTAQKNVDPGAVRAELAKSLGLTKIPAPGADKGFDSKFNAEYENKIASYVNQILGTGGGGGGDFGAVNPLLDKYAPQKR
jgi:hypothetical protein